MESQTQEQQPLSLDERVNKLEYIFNQGAKDIVYTIQDEILQDLYKLKDALQEEQQHQVPAGEGSSNVNTEKLKYRLNHVLSSFQSYKEGSQSQIKKLQEENTRLKYRVNIMKGNLK